MLEKKCLNCFYFMECYAKNILLFRIKKYVVYLKYCSEWKEKV